MPEARWSSSRGQGTGVDPGSEPVPLRWLGCPLGTGFVTLAPPGCAARPPAKLPAGIRGWGDGGSGALSVTCFLVERQCQGLQKGCYFLRVGAVHFDKCVLNHSDLRMQSYLHAFESINFYLAIWDGDITFQWFIRNVRKHLSVSDCFVLIRCLEALFSLKSLKLAARICNIFKGQRCTFVPLKYSCYRRKSCTVRKATGAEMGHAVAFSCISALQYLVLSLSCSFEVAWKSLYLPFAILQLLAR